MRMDRARNNKGLIKMIIRCDTDQIKKIRDDAFECAAKLVLEGGEKYSSRALADLLAEEIRAMKDSPVNVLVKGITVKDT